MLMYKLYKQVAYSEQVRWDKWWKRKDKFFEMKIVYVLYMIHVISLFLLHVVIIKSNFSYFTYKMKLGIGLEREFQLALTGWSNFQHGFEIAVLLG